jgi:hypothetical protein
MGLHVAFLRGGKLMVEQDNVGAVLGDRGGDFIRLAAAGKEAGVGLGAAAADQAADFEPRGFRKALELLGAFRIVGRIEVE